MTNFEDFVVPDGFTKEQIEGQLYQEDLTEDEEIWLIRMPSDIELSHLNRKKIWLSNCSGEVNIKNIKAKNGKLLECYAENCEIPNTCVLLPQRSDERLHVVNKIIKGTILISEGLAFDENTPIKSEDINAYKENTFEPEGKKIKKEKAFDFDNSDVNYETEDAESVNTSTARVKHVKRKSNIHKNNSQGVDIKTEPLSMDWDGFPPCVSQK